MKDLTNEQKRLISQKQEEYHIYSNNVNLLKNKISELSVERSDKLENYELAKEQFTKADMLYSASNLAFITSKIEYTNKEEIKFIFSLLFKSYGLFTAVSILACLLGFFDVISLKDGLNYFFCSPLLCSSLTLVCASFFSSKIRDNILKKFYSLDDTKEMMDSLDKNMQDVQKKKEDLEKKKENYLDINHLIEQLENKVKCNESEMNRIKTSIFEIISSSDENELISDKVLSMKI